MDPTFFLIIAGFAIVQAWDTGKTEYGHVRDQRAAEFARTHPDWSPGRIQKMAKRAARGYWWDQIRRGFPEMKSAYKENKELAEAARVEAETAGLKRRTDIRARIRKALEEADQIRQQERERFYGDDEPLPEAPWNKEQDTAEEPQTERVVEPKQADSPRRAEPDQLPKPPAEPVPECEPERAQPQDAPASPGPSIDQAPQVVDGRRVAPVVPIRPEATAPATATPAEGDTMTTAPTGEVHGGYEQILAGYEADIQRLQDHDAALERRQARINEDLEQHKDADAGYERQMASLRDLNVDEVTLGNLAALRETNEEQLTATEASLEKATAARETNHKQLNAAIEARDSWVLRHGSVKEAKDATGATGDQALYS